MAKDLRTFLDTVRALGPDYYRELAKPVDPELELGALQYKLSREGHDPVIFCPQVMGSDLPAVTNLIGNYELLGLALGIPAPRLRPGNRECIVKEFGQRLENFIEPEEVPTTEAPVQEVIQTGEQADLTRLPIMRHEPGNSGKYITTGISIVRDPDTGILNAGIYRQELKGPRRLAFAPSPGQHGNAIAQRYAELKRPMEVVTVIGHHPACLMGAALTRPDKRDENEFTLMGALLGEPVAVTKGRTVDLPVLARAEIVIEGIVDPLKMEREGPFSEGAGFYSEGRECWVIDVSAITMRHDAIFEDLHPTRAEHWLSFMVQSEHNVFQALKTKFPGLRAVHRGPEDMCARKILYLSIKKEQDDDGLRAGAMALQKLKSGMVIVVDHDIDACDESEVLWALATGLRRAAVVDKTTGELSAPTNPMDFGSPTDPTAPRAKDLLLLDATRPLGAPNMERAVFPRQLLDRLELADYFPRH